MEQRFYDAMADCPVVAAVKNFEGIERCMESDVRIVFILFGDMCNIAEIVERVKKADKIALVHIDLVEGLSNHEIAVDYIHKNKFWLEKELSKKNLSVSEVFYAFYKGKKIFLIRKKEL